MAVMLMRNVLAFAVVLGFGCGDGTGEVPSGFDGGGGGDAGGDAGTRASLRDTGLWSDFDNETLADGVLAYEPQFQLWTDAATKRRWVSIPEGESIDNSDANAWVVPLGSKLWKEFTRDGVRIETRLIEVTEFGFEYTTYQWELDGSDAFVVEGFGGVDNANGTDHDIPGSDSCDQCHDRTDHQILGFGEVQLSYDPGDENLVNIDDLVAADLLSDPPAQPYVVPGDPTEQAAFGYLHANCGNCHNDLGKGVLDGQNQFSLLLRVEQTMVSEVGAMQPAVIGPGPDNIANKSVPEYPAANARVDPSSAMTSQVWARMQQDVRDTNNQMPQLGSEDADATGVAAVAAWINELP